MRATARIVAVAGDRGTRLAVLSGEAPLLPRRTATTGTAGTATVHLVGGAAGPLGGDRLRVEVEVGPGAALTVHTTAATIALPHRSGARSRTDVVATVAAGGCLYWLPEPVIAAAGCRHTAVTAVDLAAGADLVWRDEVVCGRHGEEPGDLTVHTTVRRDGVPLHVHELSIGPAAPGWGGAAVLGGARAYGSMLVTGPHEPWVGRSSALMTLAGDAVLISSIGDPAEVRAALAWQHTGNTRVTLPA
jgi:urease accessory protein